MVWRFKNHGKISAEEEERIEHRAEKLVGYTFFILAAYIVYESTKKLIVSEVPEPSLFGIFIALASIIIMPVLYRMKYQTGKSLGSRSLIADSKETLACAFLSVALLVGLGANYLFGFWQADPIAGLVIAVYLIREGKEILIGEDEE
jgi:divalent metal cation (Fe/Co/Zn/Cd) transporter